MTLIEEVRKGRGYVTLLLAGEDSLRIPMPVYKERKYLAGQIFDPSSYQKLLDEREYPHALDDAVRLLSYRARSETEILRHLRQRAYREEAIARVMQRLTQEGYLSDARFADEYILSKSSRAVGKHRLVQELRQKGVDRDIIEQSIEQIDQDEALQVVARHAEKLLRRVRGKDDRDIQRKALQGLLRRGYDLGTAKEALRMAIEGDLDESLTYSDD